MAHPATVPSTLTGWLQGLMWAAGGMAVITGVVALVALNAFEDYRDAGIGTALERHAYDTWTDRHDTFGAINAVLSMLWIGMFVVTIVWMNKAHKTTQRLWRGSRKWTSGWTVGGWFIPFANFVIPKKVLNEIERIATAPRTGGVVGSGWRQESTSALGWLWWIGFSLSIVFRTIGTGLLGDLTGPDDDITAGYTTQAIGSFLTVAAMPFGALYIRGLARRLSPQGIAQTP